MGNLVSSKKSAQPVAIGPSAAAPVAASYIGVSFKTQDQDVIAVFNSMNSAMDNFRKMGFCPNAGRKIIVGFSRAIDAYFTTNNCTANLVVPSGNVPNNSQYVAAASGAQPGGVLVNCDPKRKPVRCENIKKLFAVVVNAARGDKVVEAFYNQVSETFNLILDKCCVGGEINPEKAKRLATGIVCAICWEMADVLNAPITGDEAGY